MIEDFARLLKLAMDTGLTVTPWIEAKKLLEKYHSTRTAAEQAGGEG